MIIQGYTTIQMYQAHGAARDQRRTLDGGARPGERPEHLLRGSGTVLFDAAQDPQGPRSDAAGGQKAASRDRAGIQRHGRAAAHAGHDAPGPRSAADRARSGRRRRLQPEPPKVDESSDESSLVSSFIGRVDVLPVRGSHLVDVTFTAQDPKFAATAANTLVDEYVEQNLQVKLQSTQGMLDWLERELAGQQKKVEDSERALAQYRDRENALSLDEKQNIVLSRLNQLNDAATRARTARAAEGIALQPGEIDFAQAPRRTRFRSSRRTRACRTPSASSRRCRPRR